MKLSKDQIELIRGIKSLRKTRKVRVFLLIASAIPILFVLWLQLDIRISEPSIVGGLTLLFIIWFKSFLYPSPTRGRVEDLLLDYINNDPDSLRQLTSHEEDFVGADAS